MTGLSGLAAIAAVVAWVTVIAFRSQRYAVWAVAGFSVIAFFIWKPAIENGYAAVAFWVALAVCLAGIVRIVMLLRRAGA